MQNQFYGRTSEFSYVCNVALRKVNYSFTKKKIRYYRKMGEINAFSTRIRIRCDQSVDFCVERVEKFKNTDSSRPLCTYSKICRFLSWIYRSRIFSISVMYHHLKIKPERSNTDENEPIMFKHF